MTYHRLIWQAYRDGKLTRAFLIVLLELPRFAGPGGIYPSHAALASRARCSVKTVQRALQAARELGLVSWSHRHVRAAWRALRVSNAYVLTGYRSASPTDIVDRGSSTRKEIKAYEEAQAALKAKARAMEARLAARWQRDASARRLQFAAASG
jgi:DNA-binding transcriptional MocR family regulator